MRNVAVARADLRGPLLSCPLTTEYWAVFPVTRASFQKGPRGGAIALQTVGALPPPSSHAISRFLSEGFSYSSDAITKEELERISETIYRVDTNKAKKEDIVLNSQNRVSPSETRNQVDRCPEP